MNLARTSTAPVHRVLALRAVLRLSSKAKGRTPEQMTALVTELMSLAGATPERKAVLAELGRCSTLDALRLAQKYLADSELADEAGLAVTQIAFALRDSHRDQVLGRCEFWSDAMAVASRACKVLKDISNRRTWPGATATSPDSIDLTAPRRRRRRLTAPARIGTVDGWSYRLKVTLKEPQDVSSINILWHPYEQHQAKNLDVLCDGKVVAEVRKVKCFENEMFIVFPSVRCRSVELVIPGKNGLVSPAIHEFQIFSRSSPSAGRASAQPVAPPPSRLEADRPAGSAEP
jgi:hypothetical protein